MHTAFQRVGVIGSGTMGLGIIEVLAASGFHVQVVDISKEHVEKSLQLLKRRLRYKVEKQTLTTEKKEAMIKRIHPLENLDALKDVDIVIEAAVEDIEVKHDLFKVLDNTTEEHTLLATNTSSISITSISKVTKKPERVIGLHFFNPVPKMPLVEVIQGQQTNPEYVQMMMDWVRFLGKDPVKVMDSPGFLVNRLARPFHLEAYRLVGNRIAEKEQVDGILREAGFKMGPFELQDLIGIDINYAASKSVYDGFFQDPRFRPHYKQRNMVESGCLGKKTKKGHYAYVE